MKISWQWEEAALFDEKFVNWFPNFTPNFKKFKNLCRVSCPKKNRKILFFNFWQIPTLFRSEALKHLCAQNTFSTFFNIFKFSPENLSNNVNQMESFQTNNLFAQKEWLTKKRTLTWKTLWIIAFMREMNLFLQFCTIMLDEAHFNSMECLLRTSLGSCPTLDRPFCVALPEGRRQCARTSRPAPPLSDFRPGRCSQSPASAEKVDK